MTQKSKNKNLTALEFYIKICYTLTKGDEKMFEIQIFNRKLNKWESVRPTYSKPYKYNSKKEALKILSWLYPFSIYNKNVRVLDISKRR